MDMFSLKGKVAVVTGSGSGLGYATAKRFKEAGAKVAMADINEKTAQLAEELGCYFIKTDVSKEADVENLMKTASQVLGKLDIVVNNAGIICPEELLENADKKTYEALFNVNVMGVVFGIKHGQKYMNDGGITIIEWADLIKDELPEERLEIKFKIAGEEKRILTITPYGSKYEDLCEDVI